MLGVTRWCHIFHLIKSLFEDIASLSAELGPKVLHKWVHEKVKALLLIVLNEDAHKVGRDVVDICAKLLMIFLFDFSPWNDCPALNKAEDSMAGSL